MGFVAKAVGTVGKAVGGIVGGLTGGLAGGMTQQNQYQASAPPLFFQTQQGAEQQQKFKDVQAQQQQLADVLRMQMQGQGPNPAQAQFQQNLDRVGAQQAGAIASQKGISPALAARLIAQQGGEAQVSGAGGAATLQAQQQLAAQQQLQAQQAQMAGQALQYNSMLQNAITGTAVPAMQINADVAQSNANAVQNTNAGILNAAGGALGLGSVGGSTSGGKMVGSPSSGSPFIAYGGGKVPMDGGGKVPGQAVVAGDSPKNDKVHAMLSPGEIVIPRSLVDNPERAKKFIEEINKGGSGYKKVLEAKRKAKNG